VWRLALAAALLAAVGASGCGRKAKTPPVAVKSVVEMNDAAAAGQLKSGFYGIEGGSWRWTARTFAVALPPPSGAAQKGAKLHFKFTLPDAIFDKVGPIQLSASINGSPLKPELYSKAGDYDYERDLDAGALGSGLVTAEFSCDKALEPSGGDARELALIAVSAGLEPR
jgi:hypothetical protein